MDRDNQRARAVEGPDVLEVSHIRPVVPEPPWQLPRQPRNGVPGAQREQALSSSRRYLCFLQVGRHVQQDLFIRLRRDLSQALEEAEDVPRVSAGACTQRVSVEGYAHARCQVLTARRAACLAYCAMRRLAPLPAACGSAILREYATDRSAKPHAETI